MDMGEGEAGARCLSLLAGAGADLGKRSGVRGMCALCLASVLGHVEAAQRLLDAGADIELGDDDGDGPLGLAAYHRQVALVKLLLQRGANVQAHTKGGGSAMAYACQFDADDCLREMLQAGGDPDAQRRDGLYLLYLAVHNNSMGCIKALLDAGANVSLAIDPNDNETALGQACRKGNASVVDLLLAAPTASALLIDRADDNGATPLSWACQKGKPQIAAALLRAGADKEKPNGKGGTPLMLCLSNGSDKGHLGCVRELVAAKVDVNRAGSTQAVPLVRALLADNVPGARLLLEAAAKVDVNRGGSTQAVPLVRALLADNVPGAAGARTDVRDAKGLTPLDLMVQTANAKAVRLLIEFGASTELSPQVESKRGRYGDAASRAECSELLRDPDQVRRQARAKKAEKEAKQAARVAEELEEQERLTGQAQVAEWLTATCKLSEAASARASACLAAPGYGFDSVEKLEMLALHGEQAAWPKGIDMATRLTIVRAFK